MFNVKIMEGTEYGDLVADNQSGDQIQVNYYQMEREVFFKTEGSQNPDSVAFVRVEISCNDPDVSPGVQYVEFYVKHSDYLRPGLLMTFDKNVLMPGDSTRIYLHKVTDEGEIIDFSPEYKFKIRIDEGVDYGLLYSAERDYYSIYFGEVSNEGLWYFSTGDIVQNMVNVVIYAEETGSIVPTKINSSGTIKNSSFKQLNKSNRPLRKTQILSQEVDKLKTTGDLQIVSPLILGETRYFGLQNKDDNTASRIEEIPDTVYGVIPDFPDDAGGWKWIKKSSVWSDNPISVSDSGKSGIYWEKKYYEKSTDTNKALVDGIIRVIGRYWEEGKEDDYKVTLKAQLDNKTIERELKVVKPGKLGNEHTTSTDVKGDQINIDDICIETGGKNGIPPQIIKGHMQKESKFKNDYRYEPFQDIMYQKISAKRKELFEDYDYFTVTSANMGTVSIPSNHTNVTPIAYPNQPKKIEDFLVENIWKYIQGPNAKNGNKLKVIGSETEKTGNLTKELRKYYKIFEKEKNPLTKAVDSLKNYVQSDSLKGADKYAQTRIMASYGMLQQGYWDAATGKEPLAGFKLSNSSQPPELINEKDYSMKCYTERIGRGTKNRKGNNWSEGYEKGWEKILDKYNPYEAKYGEVVLNNSKSFLPAK